MWCYVAFGCEQLYVYFRFSRRFSHLSGLRFFATRFAKVPSVWSAWHRFETKDSSHERASCLAMVMYYDIWIKVAVQLTRIYSVDSEGSRAILFARRRWEPRLSALFLSRHLPNTDFFYRPRDRDAFYLRARRHLTLTFDSDILIEFSAEFSAKHRSSYDVVKKMSSKIERNQPEFVRFYLATGNCVKVTILFFNVPAWNSSTCIHSRS